MTCGSESTQMSAYSDILLWMSKLMLVWNQGGHIQEAESQEKNTEKRKGSEQFLVQRLTLLEHGGPCLLESPAVVFFLPPEGVFKERNKIERVKKTSTAPLFGLKQTKHHTSGTNVSNMIHIFRQMASWNEGGYVYFIKYIPITDHLGCFQFLQLLYLMLWWIFLCIKFIPGLVQPVTGWPPPPE